MKMNLLFVFMQTYAAHIAANRRWGGGWEVNMAYRICIVGLGLMGASFAYALAGFRGAELVGVDTDPEVLRKAVEKGAVAKASGELRAFASEADLTLFCV
jgi:prephenate dehydrogenase